MVCFLDPEIVEMDLYGKEVGMMIKVCIDQHQDPGYSLGEEISSASKNMSKSELSEHEKTLY